MRKHLILLLGMTFAIGCGPAQQSDPGNRGPAPAAETKTAEESDGAYPLDFALKGLDGTVLTSSELRGSGVVVDFWATWCQPCLQEVPEYNRLYRKYRDRNFRFLAIALDSGDADDIRPFVSKYGIEYPIYLGTPEIPELFGGIQFYPTTFVLDQHGSVQKKYIGARPGKVADIERILEALLEK